MRSFEDDWDLIQKTRDGLGVSTITRYNHTNHEYEGEDHLLDVDGCHDPIDTEIYFINQARDMIFYYMNRVKELEEELHIAENPDDFQLVETKNYKSTQIKAIIKNEGYVANTLQFDEEYPECTEDIKKLIENKPLMQKLIVQYAKSFKNKKSE